MKAAKLLSQGLSQAEVARCLNVSRESVRRWSNQIAQHGAEGLKRAGLAGRRPRLSVEELVKLGRILRAGAKKAGFPTGSWTLDRIAQVIREQFRVEYHSRHVSWILRHKVSG